MGVVVALLLASSALGCASNDFEGQPRARPLDVLPAPAGAGVGAVAGTMAVPPATGGVAAPPVMTAGTMAPPVSGEGAVGGTGGGQVPTEPAMTGVPFDAGSDPNRNKVMPGTLCERLSTIQCAGEAHCCLNPGRDMATCKTEVKTTCSNELLLDKIAAQATAGFDAAHAEGVFNQLELLAQSCDPAVAAYGESVQGMRGIFKGTVAPGQRCTPASLLDNTQAGAALASCQNPETTSCLPAASGLVWSCDPRAGAGGHCFSDANCTPGLFCDNPDLSPAGSNCMARKAVGAPCKLGNECESLFCVGGACVAADSQAAYCLTY